MCHGTALLLLGQLGQGSQLVMGSATGHMAIGHSRHW
jgi:hypothetical protein